MRLATYGLLLLGVMSAAEADVSIEWSSDSEGTNRASDGVTPLDASFEFVLGAFEGLTPTAENVADWEGAWRPLGAVAYSTDFDWFLGQADLGSNASPFSRTARAYIWGRNGTAPGSEWILMGKSTWLWPNANPVGPALPTRWRVATLGAGDVVVGTVNEGGVDMQTVKVEFELTYAKWVELNFEEGDGSGAELDFDEDGRSNFLEYALDSDPKSGDEAFRVGLTSGFEIEVPRVAGRQVDWILEESDDLLDFEPMTEGFELAVDEPERLVFRVAERSDSSWYYRVKAVPRGESGGGE